MPGRYVRGEGNRQAKLMIVGESPGYYEENEGRPFVGPSGSHSNYGLNQFLEKGGISRSECYISNVLKYRPPDDNFERYAQAGINLQENLQELWGEIREIRPNCILAVGKQSLKYLTGRSGKNNSITENRGSILSIIAASGIECKVVPTFHMAHLLRHEGDDDPARLALFIQHDISRAVEESKTPHFNLPSRHLWIARNSLDTWRFLERNRNRKRVSLDIEVIHAVPVCIGIAFEACEAMSVPLLDFSSPFHEGKLCSTVRDAAESLRTIINFLANPDLGIIGQNFKFDHSKLENFYVKIYGKIIDTMLMHHCLYPEFPKSLEFMTSIHTREPFYKIDGAEFDWKRHKLENLLIYNARDAAVQFEIAEILMKELDEIGLTNFYFGYPKDDWRYPFCVEKLHNLYREIEKTGFAYDKEVNKQLKKKYKDLLKEPQGALDTYAETHVNVNAYKKLAFILYDHFKMPRRAGTGEDVLVGLLNSPALKNEEHKIFLSNVLEVRRLRRVISAYLNAEPDFDDRMRTSFNITGTETGRTSTSNLEPPVRPYKMGLAFHTLSKHGDIGPDLRKQFPTDSGYVYLQADSKQAEARVVFLLAEEYERLKQLDDPSFDIHGETGSWFFKCSPEEVSKDKGKRFCGKKIRHAGNYDMQKHRCMIEFNNEARRLGLDESITEWKANQYLQIFHENDPPIKNVFHQQIRDALDSTRVLIGPFGRRREFFGSDIEHMYKEGYATIPQEAVADNTKRAMLGIREEDPDIRLVLEWHDGFLALVPENEVDVYGRLFIKHMERTIDFSECSLSRGELKIPCELEFSDTNYYDLRKYELGKNDMVGDCSSISRDGRDAKGFS
jgi:uracil-DNA glycosylase family 4